MCGILQCMKKSILTVSVLALGVLGLTSASVATSATDAELQPNLEALPAADLHIENATDGRTLLRFSATTWNSGLGPLELIAGETTSTKQKVYQRIYLDDGTSYDNLAGEFVWHSDHNHFHFENYALYSLQPVDAPGASERISNKTTFCVMDTDRINHRLPGAPKKAHYTTCDADVQGMSVGWGDTYKYDLAGQDIDITDLPSGEYNLVVEVDPKNVLQETGELDNTSTVKIFIDAENGTVEIVSGGDDGGDDDDGGGNNGNGPPDHARN